MKAGYWQNKVHNMVRKSMDTKQSDVITQENCGEKLEDICNAAGISLMALANYLGEKPSTLSHMKSTKNRRNATQKFWDKLRALAAIRPKGYPHKEIDPGRITIGDVAIGLSSLARTQLLGSPAVVAGALVGGIVGGVLSFGMLQAVGVISKQFKLACRESEDELEITKEPNG